MSCTARYCHYKGIILHTQKDEREDTQIILYVDAKPTISYRNHKMTCTKISVFNKIIMVIFTKVAKVVRLYWNISKCGKNILHQGPVIGINISFIEKVSIKTINPNISYF